MRVECEKHGPNLLCRLNGEFDLTGASAFRKEVKQWLDRYEGIRNIVLDMSGVDFVDSSGLGAILGRYKQLQGLGGQLVVYGVQPHVKRVFEFSGVLKLVRTAESLDGALSAV